MVSEGQLWSVMLGMVSYGCYGKLWLGMVSYVMVSDSQLC